MITRILRKLFYNPYKYIKQFSNIQIADSTILTKQFSVEFRIPTNSTTLLVSGETMLSCMVVFESDQGNIKIGERTFINEGTRLISRNKIIIGNDVMIAGGCFIYDHNSHSIDWQKRAQDIKDQNHEYRNKYPFGSLKNWEVVKSAPIVIEDKVWIGFDVTILKGVTIGEGAIIGAKSVIREDVPAFSIVFGNPGRVIQKITNIPQ